ncbi:hypothetical protein [Flagellimonas zhangzhouensis]|uniref:Uncharacterized protein n=1 Tax=Flagellimonas zhangzhouensis TaxID=1073328 RepID=A0A1H2VWD5_9FLAO|nr:hypothetical protein [Allomuricauda zhangzhouensis]SDQ05168.1 hypothetical protein SAMN05216294_0037 [Allomuricauda zhangzhouensis]SDW72678.1 hypothetical protein SAMN04487892_2255 [Allomuricauda zhangzhouensis]
MKNYFKISFLALIFILCVSCSSYKKSEITGRTLPASETENQNTTIRRQLNSDQTRNYQKVVLNKKEYPIEDLQKILDTLQTEYTLEVKIDSVVNKQIVYINPKS